MGRGGGVNSVGVKGRKNRETVTALSHVHGVSCSSNGNTLLLEGTIGFRAYQSADNSGDRK